MIQPIEHWKKETVDGLLILLNFIKTCCWVMAYLLVKDNLFLDNFELGRFLAVSGDTPTVPLVTLVLFMGPLLAACCFNSAKELSASLLNASRSKAAFSSVSRRRVHILHMCGESMSLSSTWTPRTVDILEGHFFSRPLALNK